MNETIEQKVELESCGLPTQDSREEMVQMLLPLQYSCMPKMERQYRQLIDNLTKEYEKRNN